MCPSLGQSLLKPAGGGAQGTGGAQVEGPASWVRMQRHAGSCERCGQGSSGLEVAVMEEEEERQEVGGALIWGKWFSDHLVAEVSQQHSSKHQFWKERENQIKKS